LELKIDLSFVSTSSNGVAFSQLSALRDELLAYEVLTGSQLFICPWTFLGFEH